MWRRPRLPCKRRQPGQDGARCTGGPVYLSHGRSATHEYICLRSISQRRMHKQGSGTVGMACTQSEVGDGSSHLHLSSPWPTRVESAKVSLGFHDCGICVFHSWPEASRRGIDSHSTPAAPRSHYTHRDTTFRDSNRPVEVENITPFRYRDATSLVYPVGKAPGRLQVVLAVLTALVPVRRVGR